MYHTIPLSARAYQTDRHNRPHSAIFRMNTPKAPGVPRARLTAQPMAPQPYEYAAVEFALGEPRTLPEAIGLQAYIAQHRRLGTGHCCVAQQYEKQQIYLQAIQTYTTKTWLRPVCVLAQTMLLSLEKHERCHGCGCVAYKMHVIHVKLTQIFEVIVNQLASCDCEQRQAEHYVAKVCLNISTLKTRAGTIKNTFEYFC